MTQESRLAVTIDSRGAKRNADDLAESLKDVERAGEGATKSTEGLSAGLDEQRKELTQLLGSINPTVAALGRLDDMQEKLAKFKKAGIVESDTFVEYTQRINTMREALGQTSEGMSRTGLSAKQMNNSLRMLPAQFSDIAISLQAGQAPFTVFLQQGAQIKDSFGGVGPALSAVGGYALSLVTPLTIAASAIGAFGLAAYKGYELSEQYRKALVLTGDAAGKTADDLIALSTAIASGRNFAEAGQAVSALAGNGRLAGAAFNEVARAATEMAVATGKGAADIADQLSNTKTSVTELAAEYSEKYGIITQAVFNQVRSLEQQGERMEAVRVLAGAVADEMGARNKEMIESTRGLAKAWDEVKTSVTSAWNELKTGLSASPELFKLQHLQSQLQRAREIGDKALITGLEKQVELAQASVDLQNQKAKSSAAELSTRKATIAADKAWFDAGLKYRSLEQQRDEDIAKARAQGLAAKVSEEEIEKRIAKIREDYAKREPKQPKQRAVGGQNRGVAEAENTFARLYGQYDPAAQAARALTKEQGQLDLALTKGKISQDEYGKALAQASLNYAAAIKGAQGLTAAEQYRAQLERQLQTDRDENRVNAAAVGAGDLQAERARSQIQLVRDTNTTIQNLMTERDRTESEREKQALQRQIDLQREYLPQRIAELQNGWAQMDQAMLNPINGWTAAVQNFGNQARDIAGQTESIFSSAFNNISADITDAIMSGQLSFSTLGDIAGNVVRDILAGFVKMGVQMALNAALNATLGTAAAGQSMILAGTTATAWAPAAAMASLATLGANSVPAAAALTSTTALASSLAVIPGFATGGYVSGAGTGTSDSIMARLSDGEFVVNAAATKRNRALLEAINSNERVSVAGGGGSAVTTQSSAQSGGSQTNQVIHQVTIENYSQSQVETRTDPDGRLRVLVQAVKEQIADEFAAGYGPVVDAGEAAYGWKRNPY
ncbi:phage tail length tape measure family protein [Pseudomonas putida]|uniref:Phage tail length tape measure family protein n=1 Tax=Pseudomonas putida TaxID=303 RepID=A0ABD7BJG1_PSEPU|nr:phage tail length tape measure family protein [Pseudomonas putida]QOD00383.1 phage tail length tape measure family protein [Pseudomonas putida]